MTAHMENRNASALPIAMPEPGRASRGYICRINRGVVVVIRER
jgi:hypothetical protein